MPGLIPTSVRALHDAAGVPGGSLEVEAAAGLERDRDRRGCR
jgi:hypothetical protein